MKIKYFFSVLITAVLFFSASNLNAQAPTVSITASPNNTLTCAVPQITLTGYCSTSGTATPTFTWNSVCGTWTAAAITVTSPCVYTVTATDPNTSLTNTYTLQVFKDVAVATLSVSPGTANLTCAGAPTFTGAPAPLSNYGYKWYAPCILGGSIIGYLCTPGCAGTFTFEATNFINGCTAIKTVTVTAAPSLPSLTITAQNNNYVLDCTTCATLQVTAMGTGTCGALVAEWKNSTGTATLSNNNTLAECVPGNYMASIYCTTASTCLVTQLVSIDQQTLGITSITVSGSPSVCPGNNATLTASGASSYTWNTGSNSSSITVSPTVTTVYSVAGYGGNPSLPCGAVKTVSIGPSVNMVVNGNSNICLGSSTTFTASGASTYSWNTGPTTNTINVMPSTNTSYYLTGSASGSCTASQTINVAVNSGCRDVWPGDANSDGAANNLDILEVGMQFATTGSARSTQSNLWQAFAASTWTGVTSNGKNRVYSDCNGDGQVDIFDTTAVSNNYGFTHSFKPAVNTNTTNLELYMIHDFNTIAPGMWGASGIYLGDASNQLNLYGFSFDLNFDSQYIVPDSIWLEYPFSFFDAGNSYINFKKNNFANAVVHSAVTRTDHANLTGNGMVAKIHYKFKPALPDIYFHIGFNNCYRSNANISVSSLSCGMDSVIVSQSFVGINENTKTANVTVFPNPAQNTIGIKCDKLISSVTIKDVAGRNVFEKTLSPANLQSIDVKNLANGVYHLSVFSEGILIKQEKVVISK